MSKIDQIVRTKGYKNFMAKLYGWGASVVILGALFKILHLPGANIMLILGMGIESVIFFFSAFVLSGRPPEVASSRRSLCRKKSRITSRARRAPAWNRADRVLTGEDHSSAAGGIAAGNISILILSTKSFIYYIIVILLYRRQQRSII